MTIGATLTILTIRVVVSVVIIAEVVTITRDLPSSDLSLAPGFHRNHGGGDRYV